MHKKENALLVDIVLKEQGNEEKEFRKEELIELVNTYGKVNISEVIAHKTAFFDTKTFLKPGMIESLILLIQKYNATSLILGNILKPRQIFELSEKLRPYNINVMDRVDLILQIFSLHAQTSEAKLQIELAKIRHMGPRIFRMGDELSRQGGGIGTRGKGETNTEIMKRHLAKEETEIIKKLEKISQQKAIQRHNRDRHGFKTLALVGYTNAGKSTLMNTLSKKGVHVKDALFETLDTRIGRVYFPELKNEVLISDTIGFINDLPPSLISAFKSTLEESIFADVVLHVVDVSDPKVEEKIQIVDEILEQLDITTHPQILIFNKYDQAKKRFGKIRLTKKYKHLTPVFISALEKDGIEDLKKVIAKKLN